MDKIVAIVGQPNVGKSTLFNRLVKKRSAIVDFEEGVTRDRKYDYVEWNGKQFILVDTGGIVPEANDTINKAIKFQANIAIEEADLIIFMVDVKIGVTNYDIEIAKILSRHRSKIMLVANKVDNEKDFLDVYDFLQLGFGEPFAIAANHGRNTGDFLDKLVGLIKPEIDIQEPDEDTVFVSIVGKPNVGKSSIVNRLIGEEKVIVSDIPGTTRDSTDSTINYFGKKIVFIDTAGLRKKKRIKYGVEYFSSMRTINAIDRSKLVLLILDATSEISSQDQKIASYAYRRKKEILIIFNKWDLIKKDNHSVTKYLEKVHDELPFLEFAPVHFVSALSGQRIHQTLKKILEVEEEAKKRIPTAELNRFLEKAVQHFPPTHSSGKHVKIYYMTQINVQPPVFVYFCNKPEYLTVHYKRYLKNQLRKEFVFKGTSIKQKFRGRDNNDNFDN